MRYHVADRLGGYGVGRESSLPRLQDHTYMARFIQTLQKFLKAIIIGFHPVCRKDELMIPDFQLRPSDSNELLEQAQAPGA